MIQERFKGLANQDFRELIDRKGVFLWEIARHLGRSEMWMTRKMRAPLSGKDMKVFIGAVAAIEARKKAQQEEE